MQIRYADAGRDGAACAAIYAPFVLDGPISFEERPPSKREMAQRIERISETHPWLVGVLDGEVLGFAYGSPHHERAAYRWAADVAVYVDTAHQGRGAGRALYGTLMTLLARQGMQVACAGIALPNEASIRLHEACGFKPVGVYRRIGWKHGAWRDVSWWQAELAPAGTERPPEPTRPPALERPPEPTRPPAVEQ